MDYKNIFGCVECENMNSQGECKRKNSFDNDDPSTCPFLYCPFFRFNYELMIPEKGNFYILYDNVHEILYTPIYWDIEPSEYLTLRKCEIHEVGSCKHLVLDMTYPYCLSKDREYIISNSSVVYIDQSAIVR